MCPPSNHAVLFTRSSVLPVGAVLDSHHRACAWLSRSLFIRYLEDIVCSAQSSAADEVTRTEIQAKAAEVDRVAQELFESGMDQTEACAMTVSAELVSQYLLPEADQTVMRERIKQKQKAMQLAAHKELVSAAESMESAVSTEMQKRKAASAGRRAPKSANLRAVHEAGAEGASDS